MFSPTSPTKLTDNEQTHLEIFKSTHVLNFTAAIRCFNPWGTSPYFSIVIAWTTLGMGCLHLLNPPERKHVQRFARSAPLFACSAHEFQPCSHVNTANTTTFLEDSKYRIVICKWRGVSHNFLTSLLHPHSLKPTGWEIVCLRRKNRQMEDVHPHSLKSTAETLFGRKCLASFWLP